ncbi:hypothetical protein EJB05_51855, partial [Eragrostis curvula]
MTAPSPFVLLVPALLLLLLPLAAASTLAVSGAYPPTVCGVHKDNGTVLCAPLAGNSSNASYSVAPFLAFAEVSAGRGFVCGLKTGGAALFCWPPASPALQLKRVYNGPGTLTELAVGAYHVAAYDQTARGIQWWRDPLRRFPPAPVRGAFRSLVSGDGFSCAVEEQETNSTSSAAGAVRCWGPRGSDVQAAFANASGIAYLAAGGARACGVETPSGAVRCSGSDSFAAAVPRDLYPYGLAVGDAHACGLRKPNQTAVCWTLGGPTTTVFSPAVGTSFELLAADGNHTCGVTSIDFGVLCWSSAAATDLVAAPAPLQGIIPGVCVADETSCDCGFLAQSAQLCKASGGGVICKRLCLDAPSPPPAVSPPPASPSPPPASKGGGVSKRWIAFAVVGAVGAFAGLCSIVYCLVFGFCSNKRVHNSVQPNLTTTAASTAADNNNNNNNNGSRGPSPYGSPNGSRARQLFRRQLSRSQSQQPPQHLTVKAAGTVGYMDPEYYGLHHLTVKSDVYGFGVVMLESLTGKRAIFKEAEGGSPVSVVDHAVPSIVAGELAGVLDPRAPEPAPHEAEAVELVAYTAVHCVRLEGKDRPAMADIVANLETAFALCEGSAGGADRGGGGGFGNSSSSASLSVTSMDRSGALV